MVEPTHLKNMLQLEIFPKKGKKKCLKTTT